MDHGKYKDFNEETPNELWTFLPDDGKNKIEYVRLNHAISGDSDSIYCALPDKLTEGSTDEEIVEMTDIVCEHVNACFPSFIMDVFNCPEERSDSMLSEREVVASRAMLLSKKRYVMRVINDEGKWVDKTKIMGVEIIRSDTPEVVQDMLMEIVNMVLADSDMEPVHQRINELKQEYRKESLQRIARPMSVKGLKKYNDEYEMTGSMKSFPYQVRAAMFYNSLCGPADKQIVPGDKIGILYIKNRKSKYVAFPSDLNTLPSFMYDLIIDYDTQWDKAYKKITNYLEAMGWDIKSRKKEVKKQLFGF